MSNFAAEVYEELKAAYSAVLTGIAEGAPVVKYAIRTRQVEREPSEKLLKTLMEQIQMCEKQMNRSGSSIFRPVALRGASPRGDN